MVLGSRKPRSLNGIVVAITGGARGIGYATAEQFIAAGAHVAIGDIDGDEANHAATRLGDMAIAVDLDVTDAESFENFLNKAIAQFGRLDVLVNNAGIMPFGAYLDESTVMTDRQVAINLGGVLNGCRLAGSIFVRQGHGHIVNMASLGGVAAVPGAATYSATKHAVIGLTDSLRDELGPAGVGLSLVLPGMISTELGAGIRASGWMMKFAAAEPGDVAAALVSAVARKREQVAVPGRLGVALKILPVVPKPLSRSFLRAAGLQRAFLHSDRAAREAYEKRIARQ